VCDSIRAGIRVRDEATLDLSYTSIRDIHDQSFGGCQNGEGIRLGQTGHMDDQRVEARPFLGSEDRSDRALVGRIPTEPIDRLGRKGDELPAAQ